MPDKKQQILAQLARLESVERRWLGSVLASMFLGSFMLGILVFHLEMGHILTNQPAEIPRFQFLLMIMMSAAIFVMNLAAFIDYFAFSVHVERQVIITKKHRRSSTSDEEEDNDESG